MLNFDIYSNMSEFVTFLESKKIDALKFKSNEAEVYMKWEKEFEHFSEKNFTQQKLFLINEIRRRFKLSKAEIAQETASEPKNVASKPSIKPKFK